MLEKARSRARTSSRAPSCTPGSGPRLIPDWKERGAPPRPARDRRRLRLPERALRLSRTSTWSCRRFAQQTTATTSSAWATSPSGWAVTRSTGAEIPSELCRRRGAVQPAQRAARLSRGGHRYLGISKEGEPTGDSARHELHASTPCLPKVRKGYLQQLDRALPTKTAIPCELGIGIKEL